MDPNNWLSWIIMAHQPSSMGSQITLASHSVQGTPSLLSSPELESEGPQTSFSPYYFVLWHTCTIQLYLSVSE